jgi:FG-GAP-like repeat
VFISNGDGTFAGNLFTYPNGWNFGDPSQANYVPPIVGDFNGDGKTDLIFFGTSTVNSVTSFVMMGKGDGTFSGSSFPSASAWSINPQYTPIVGDFNGDGKADYVFVTATASYFMLGNGDGSFSQFEFTYPNGWNFGSPPSVDYAPIVGDFTGDGKIDFGFAGATVFFELLATFRRKIRGPSAAISTTDAPMNCTNVQILP